VCFQDWFVRRLARLNSDDSLGVVAGRTLIFDNSGATTGLFPHLLSYEALCERPWNGFYLVHPSWMDRANRLVPQISLSNPGSSARRGSGTAVAHLPGQPLRRPGRNPDGISHGANCSVQDIVVPPQSARRANCPIRAAPPVAQSRARATGDGAQAAARPAVYDGARAPLARSPRRHYFARNRAGLERIASLALPTAGRTASAAWYRAACAAAAGVTQAAD